MIQTLPLVLFIVLAELSIGSFTLLFVLDWRSEVKRSFLILYGLIYIVLTGITYLFQQSFSTPQLLNSFTQLDKGCTGHLALPLLLFLLLMLPYNLLLWLDKKAGVAGKDRWQTRTSPVRALRLSAVGRTVLAGS